MFMTCSSARIAHINPEELPKVSNFIPADVYLAKMAFDDDTREDAYRLRYQCYLASGHIEPNNSGLFSDDYDLLPNSRTIVLYRDGDPVASVRVCLLLQGAGQRSPCYDAFPETLDRIMRDAAHAVSGPVRVAEYTRLVRDPSLDRGGAIVYLLYRIASYVSMMSHAQITIACVRKSHASFYRRLGYQAETTPQPYPGLKCRMQLMSSDRKRFDELRAAFPIMDPFTTATGPLDDFMSGGAVYLRAGDLR
ncbi:N-acyl amino acid synthase, PEP-CTERM/exosortase system-associated [Acetobacteraceae bacterium EV16G]|uniref:N-acyl amino acid synthase, PEP-CTERM/exosortase system-associated n=2 Tax=Sorlinia euscelidii TaxID=3081148 RepID=A0ABU7TZC5_9PROT